MKKLVLHVILNSHLDPIWLWNLSQGIDEVLATAHSACNLLDDYTQIHITRGEAWFYEMVEKHAPSTFRRIQQHVQEGRWHIVGNWYVQADCNLASAVTYREHALLSSKYFKDKFGISQVLTGYNVDSFGHSAYLPSFYAEAGMKNYIFMRPSPEEKPDLPAENFIWLSPDGKEVLTSRLPDMYCTSISNIEGHVRKVIETADRKLGHALCFVGVGDHGAGPTREEVDWLLAHKDAFPDVEIRFSHPDAFFEEIRKSKAKLPVYQGELQHHSIGCYSALSRIKHEVRLTENSLVQAAPYLAKAEHDKAWKPLLFATFHDVLAGTCIKSAYQNIFDMLGYARTIANSALLARERRLTAKLKPCSLQKIIFDNHGDETFSGIFEFQPFLSLPVQWGMTPRHAIQLLNEDRKEVQYQMLQQESATGFIPRMAFQLDMQKRSRRIFYIDYHGSQEAAGSLDAAPLTLEKLSSGRKNLLKEPLSFQVLKDSSDTWTHRLRGYTEPVIRTFEPKGIFTNLENGALLQESIGSFADSDCNTLTAIVRREAGVDGLRIRLRIQWHGTQELLKLVIKPAFKVVQRIDGVTGGPLERRLDGEEWPMFNYCWLKGSADSIAFVSCDCTACDVQPDGTLRVTLLRSPYYAHHEPAVVPEISKFPPSDQGEHEFDIMLLANPSEEDIRRQAYRQTAPVHFTESTFGVNRSKIE